ncbi:hypothetical protein FRC07_004995 [Ceratobasidium sp. 392]|nr:hypothetical protein FRC07_004995 [Ceratobasidium sp. 392]
METIVPTHTSQNLPADILIAIFSILLTPPTELYAPLLYSHVCAHWRRVAIGAPLLWSYINTSRGRALTRLWLSRSKKVKLDVRLWQYPRDGDLMHHVGRRLAQSETTFNYDDAIQDVKDECFRWRSLDIAFCTMSHVAQTLEFLGDPYDTLHLDSLAIGPMGLTTLVPDENIIGRAHGAFPLIDIDSARTLFENLNVRCRVLRVDTHPICVSPVIFSPRLTVLEVFTGGYYGHETRLPEWNQILSLTPNLIHLRLINFRHSLHDANTNPDEIDHPVNLPALEKLELSGAFILVARLFQKSALPKLEYLLLDTLDSLIGAEQLIRIATISPPIRRLKISIKGISPWDSIFRNLSLIQEITLFEMKWMDAHTAMSNVGVLKELKSIRLERIWDLNSDSPMLSDPLIYNLPPIEFVDCHSPTKGPDDDSEYEGSTFSENSALSRIEEEFPSSESSDSDESERSYGEDEGSDMGKCVL